MENSTQFYDLPTGKQINFLSKPDYFLHSITSCIHDLMHKKKKKKVPPGIINKLDYLFKFFRESEKLTHSLQNQKDYFMCIQEIAENCEKQRVFGLWCFNAGVAFKKLMAVEPDSILLTSGTLSPLESF